MASAKNCNMTTEQFAHDFEVVQLKKERDEILLKINELNSQQASTAKSVAQRDKCMALSVAMVLERIEENMGPNAPESIRTAYDTAKRAKDAVAEVASNSTAYAYATESYSGTAFDPELCGQSFDVSEVEQLKNEIKRIQEEFKQCKLRGIEATTSDVDIAMATAKNTADVATDLAAVQDFVVSPLTKDMANRVAKIASNNLEVAVIAAVKV